MPTSRGPLTLLIERIAAAPEQVDERHALRIEQLERKPHALGRVLDPGEGVSDIREQVLASAQVAATLETTSIAVGDRHGRTVVLTGTDSGVIRWFDGADLTELAPPGRFAEQTAPTGYARNPRHWPGPGAVTQLDVSGTMVISAAGDTVTCADIATGEPSGPPLVHPGKVWAILPALLDGVPAVATSCADHTLRIWHTTTGQTIQTCALGAADSHPTRGAPSWRMLSFRNRIGGAAP